MSEEQFIRISRFIGDGNVSLLHSKCVSVVGVGAVGGFAIEELARSGVGEMRIMDFDRVAESNINRQIIATHSTVGQYKTEVMERRIHDINPDCIVRSYTAFADSSNRSLIFDGSDLVLDCIDTLSAKISLLEDAYKSGKRIISSMGAALRRDISLIRTADLFDTYGCPLAKQVRSGLRKRGVGRGIMTVFSPENVRFDYIDPEIDNQAEEGESGRKRRVLGSLPTITACFGINMAHLALKALLPDGTLEGSTCS